MVPVPHLQIIVPHLYIAIDVNEKIFKSFIRFWLLIFGIDENSHYTYYYIYF